VFAAAELSLSAIQSRPSKRAAWDYLFFFELRGHAAEPRVQEALRAIEQHTVFLKVLGLLAGRRERVVRTPSHDVSRCRERPDCRICDVSSGAVDVPHGVLYQDDSVGRAAQRAARTGWPAG
jgi:hypothetical protein